MLERDTFRSSTPFSFRGPEVAGALRQKFSLMPPKPAKKPLTSKKPDPPVRKKSHSADGVEVLLKERLAEIKTAEAVFNEAAALVEKYKKEYPELAQYEAMTDLKGYRISFKQTLTLTQPGETPELAVFELRINEHGETFSAKRAGKEKETVGADHWTFYLHDALAGIVAAILHTKGKA
jgi:hypothetical protein